MGPQKGSVMHIPVVQVTSVAEDCLCRAMQSVMKSKTTLRHAAGQEKVVWLAGVDERGY